ncbi:MAG: magnesium chelatase ATPase subunit I [Rhizobiaceae bacterium]|nr:magnesium chelatase ATPase subunit I [Hyphomicrobiales bacterium]NRB30393.1 magnesium chelatase ATPase subunit I [Rhizobiaceae bacterium]
MAATSVSYPFAAIVGQDSLKHALMLSAVDPSLGGVLAMGDRGTGKTTAVRALAALLPKMSAVTSCQYRCNPIETGNHCEVCGSSDADAERKVGKIDVPVVNLPLGATEDRVLGALDIERALIDGEKVFEPGLLAKANRGYLYIDEVNLLEDHLVDVLLDVAASGWNVIEREGLSLRHPARFVLVGSGNPEEGELRPQLLDRFGLSVEVQTPNDIAQRIEIIKRREAFEADPQGFAKKWQRQNSRLRNQVLKARDELATVQASDDILALIAQICIALGTDGLRGELTLIKAARAEAALKGGSEISPQNVRSMAAMALNHRMRRDPLDDAQGSVRVERALEKIFNDDGGS